MSDGLVPVIIAEEKPMWVVIEDTDVIKRRTLTLKQIKHLCEERDIDLLGPKGGQLSKKALLERLEADIEREHQEEVDKAHEEASIVKNYQTTKIRVFERELKRKIKPYLSGVMIKSEELNDTKFCYLPLIKVAIIFYKTKGLFKKTVTEIPENLYLGVTDTHPAQSKIIIEYIKE